MGSLPAGHMPGVNELFRRHVPRPLLPEARAEAAPPPSQPLQLASTKVAFTRRRRGRGSSLQGCTDRRVAPGIRRTRVAAAGAGGGSSLSGRYLPSTTHPPPSSLRVRGGGAAPLGPVSRWARGPQVSPSGGPPTATSVATGLNSRLPAASRGPPDHVRVEARSRTPFTTRGGR